MPPLEHVPPSPGVYFLYRGGRLIYIGVAGNGGGIREALASHVASACAACTRQDTTFRYELAPDPRRRHAQYLRAYRQRHEGRVPACNECRPCGC